MKVYLYRIGETIPLQRIENVRFYTDRCIVTEDGTVYEPLADNVELSSKEDCSEALRADWREDHPTAEQRVDELESLIAEMLFGGESE